MGLTGVYLRTLRDEQGLSRARVARMLDVTEMTITRVEAGENEPGSALLFKWVRAIRGKIEDVERLLLDPSTGVDDARQLARDRFAEIAASMTDEELKRTLLSIRRKRGADASDVLDDDSALP